MALNHSIFRENRRQAHLEETVLGKQGSPAPLPRTVPSVSFMQRYLWKTTFPHMKRGLSLGLTSPLHQLWVFA